MPFISRYQYYRRVFQSYLLPGASQLTFWHGTPKVNENAAADELGEYYMGFWEKADYQWPCDSTGVPMLDYHGEIGLQYNPIAIAQWGLGNYNLFRSTRDAEREEKFWCAAEWLHTHLERNPSGLWVWNHNFDWEYRTRLIAPWYSGLAQGQGISLLVRAFAESGDSRYLDGAERAFESFLKPVDQGGVVFRDANGDPWFEEYIVSPPTHILNGFIWAAWGVHDYFLATKDRRARELFDQAISTIVKNLGKYDLGFWSLYELSGTRLPMVASPFYHHLHIVQLRVMHKLTGNESFRQYAAKWEHYAESRTKRTRALCYKGAFKLCYY
jgi:heparosan-N-sulfate-glucuronate 5-epimerase